MKAKPCASEFQPKSDFLRALTEPDIFIMCSDWAGLDEKRVRATSVAYIGSTAPRPSLHVGSLLQIMMLALAAKAGGSRSR